MAKPESTKQQSSETSAENQRLLFRALSQALTGGNASTWDQVIHAAEQAGRQADKSAVLDQMKQRRALWEAEHGKYDDEVLNASIVGRLAELDHWIDVLSGIVDTSHR